jgi:uncharacterized membrane protein
VVISALLSAVHLLTLALGAGAIYARGRALARPLDEAGWNRLLAADNAWGGAAALWIASGLARVFYGAKERPSTGTTASSGPSSLCSARSLFWSWGR